MISTLYTEEARRGDEGEDEEQSQKSTAGDPALQKGREEQRYLLNF